MTREQREEFRKLAERLQLSDKQHELLESWISDVLYHQSEVNRREAEQTLQTLGFIGDEKWP